ncbi:DUF1016 N-terminal domain-containing protein [Pontibacter sp. SGAir0037]|uniref:DUF1016 N-terminal domain-containing protein n=1 Tax=Pontibacter sp. SGAir0037 TaxID=2571030 RepID=UPI00197D9FD3
MAEALQPQFGSGFSKRHLHWYGHFYRTISIVFALCTQFSWTHYKILEGIENEDNHEFYIAEAAKNNWSARQLERQVNSQLFERLLLSNDVARRHRRRRFRGAGGFAGCGSKCPAGYV